MRSLKIKRFFVIVACLLLTGAFASVSAQQDNIWIDTDYSGSNGNEIDIAIMIQNDVTEVSTFRFQMNYDPEWFEFISGRRGSLTLNWQNFSADLTSPGEIVIEGSNIQHIPIGSNGAIAQITLEVDCMDCEDDDTTELLLSRLIGDLERFRVQNGMFTYETASCINHGDVNLDGEVTSTDAQLAFFIVLGTYSPEYEEWCAADCLGTGEVTAADAQAIFFVVLGLGDCADSL